MGHLLAAVDRRDVPIETETSIEGLVTEDLVDRYEFVSKFESAAPPIVHGDHLEMSRPLGADVVSGRQEARLPAALPGVHVHGEEVEGEPMYRALKTGLGAPGTVVVDEDGQRFCNEAFWQDFVSRVGQIDVFADDYAHWPCFLVLDNRHRERYPLAGIDPGRDISQQVGEKADTLPTLAERLGIDPAGLAATVEQFNEYAARGHDPDFRRGETPHEEKFRGDPTHEPNANLAPLTEPPRVRTLSSGQRDPLDRAPNRRTCTGCRRRR